MKRPKLIINNMRMIIEDNTTRIAQINTNLKQSKIVFCENSCNSCQKKIINISELSEATHELSEAISRIPIKIKLL